MNKNAKQQRIRYIFVTIVFIIITSALFVSIFLKLYEVSKENLIHMWSNNTFTAASDVGFYLTMPTDAVAFSAVTINEMTEKGTTHKQVWEYLINETKIYSMIINENNTGVYSYYKGEYLDGSQWDPPADYKPTERPWYTTAVAAGGRITMVDPYLNIQTDTVMMSVSQLLDDGESVVSMDIFLDSVQQKVEELAQDSLPEYALVINNKGYVVAHSHPDQVGKDYSRGTDKYEHRLIKQLATHKNDHFEISGPNGRDIVFSQQINEDWNLVLIISESDMLSSLQSIYLVLGLVLFAVILIILGIFMFISRKHRESVTLSNEIMAVANIYATVVQIDMKTGNMDIIRSNDDIEDLLSGNKKDFPGHSRELASKISSERSRDLVIKFMDPDTLPERLSGVNSISQEFMDDKGHWIRLRFVVVNRDRNNKIEQLLWMFESIDEDRKQQEKLRTLSETDLMTGIRNRGSGETMVRHSIAEGREGMFMLLDADDFKSVNDNFGHAVGDKVIVTIAESLKKAFRDSDIVFRLGGDEFAVFAEGITNEDFANKAINRFIDNMNTTHLPELQGRVITVSVGATFYTDTQQDTFEEIYQRADEGTYESKRHGKNCISYKYYSPADNEENDNL